MSYNLDSVKGPTIQVVNRLPILGLLGLIFVIAKIGGFINWSWWLVTLPFWIGPALGLAILALVFGGIGIVLGAIWVFEKITGR